jgi:hypothetical protein
VSIVPLLGVLTQTQILNVLYRQFTLLAGRAAMLG